MNVRISAALAAIVVSVGAFTHAATVQLDTSDFIVENSIDTVTLPGFTLAANSNRTLVVTVGGERADSIGALTFDGTPLTQAALNHSGQTHASVWYLDIADTGGSVSGDVTLTWSGSDNGFALGAFSLFDVQSGGPVGTDDGGNDGGNDITLSYTASNGDMIIEAAAGQSGTITAPAGLTTLYNFDSGGGGGYAAAAGHEGILADGAEDNTWQYNLGNPPRSRAAGALFAPVPEPSTLALAALGLLGLVGWAWRVRSRRVA